jgi:putative membrane protein
VTLRAVPEPSFPSVLLEWPFEPPVWATCIALSWSYEYLLRRTTGPPRWRRWCFHGGTVTLLIALAGPIAAYDTVLFSVHMMQHLLLTMVAAPLLLLGAPVSMALRAASPPARRRVAALLHSVPVRAATHPVTAWSAFALTMWMVHFTAVYDAALRHEVVHVLEHGLLFASALLFWRPVVGGDPGPGRLTPALRIPYLIVAIPQQSFLGLALWSATDLLYGSYAAVGRAWGPSAMDDQRAGAAIMWIGGDLLFVAALIVALLAWMRAEEGESLRAGAATRG